MAMAMVSATVGANIVHTVPVIITSHRRCGVLILSLMLCVLLCCVTTARDMGDL